MDWFCWENLNRTPLGSSHQLWGFPWFSCKFILNQSIEIFNIRACVTVQAQAVDEAAVENQDQMPADPQEPLEETVESCLLQVMQGGWHSWYMMVYVGMFSRDVKCAKSKRCGSSFLEVRCMDLGEDLVHPWFARFCKHNFDVSEMCVCVCVFSLAKQCWKACLKTSQCIQSYGLWTCWIGIRVVLVPTLMVLLLSSLSFLNLCCDPSPKNFPPTSGCGWSGGRKSGPDASRSTRTSGRNGGVLSVTSDAGWLT